MFMLLVAQWPEAGLGAAEIARFAAVIVPRIAIPTGDELHSRAIGFVDPPLFRRIALITCRGHAASPVVAHMMTFMESMLHAVMPENRSN